MAYQINALFDDGHLLMSEILDAPTPKQGDEIQFWRDGCPMVGTVKKIQPRRIVALHGPTRIVDEVHFRQVTQHTDGPNDRPLRRLLKSFRADICGNSAP